LDGPGRVVSLDAKSLGTCSASTRFALSSLPPRPDLRGQRFKRTTSETPAGDWVLRVPPDETRRPRPAFGWGQDLLAGVLSSRSWASKLERLQGVRGEKSPPGRRVVSAANGSALGR